ncbi:DoxX-like family protein [Mucilaginibacter sp. OK268]|jgi:hypothetical protein|uniref:DoxX family protein n=1 Tax=Mucilaginibacter sp. OK268 TaxID=1881048 RepID=UPI00088A8E6C|nr:DoxX family protein [Mucilaginibacter sp. OK268]SDP07866.1 DoxX-like family protein [Mucilaginibacter sp. OK268]
MKKDKIIYWVTTGIVAAMMVFSAYGYFTNQEMKGAFVHLGFPNYFRIELGVMKILGALALILPMVPKKLKEFAYFGFALTFISAFIGHYASDDPLPTPIMPLIFLGILAASYIYKNKIQNYNQA